MNVAIPIDAALRADPAAKPPLLTFLEHAHARFRDDFSGAVADYIPDLSKADPAKFGVAIATIDGHVYEVGDAAFPFTIQSVSKAFVFGLALDVLGAGHVESFVGVEPSGEAFNSIRLNAKNQPFNPMVNAGAIACSGLIYQAQGADAFDVIQDRARPLCRTRARRRRVGAITPKPRPATATAPSAGCCAITAS